MIRYSIVLAGVLAMLMAVGCGIGGSRGASNPRKSRPAAVDLQVAERFASHYLGRIDQLSCGVQREANAQAVPEDDVSCSARRFDDSEMRGISFHCRSRGTRAPEGPACRLGPPPSQTRESPGQSGSPPMPDSNGS